MVVHPRRFCPSGRGVGKSVFRRLGSLNYFIMPIISLEIANLHMLETGTSIEFLSMPLHQFKWLIILSALALHGIIAVILTELMGRSYGKSMLWFAIAFFLPLVGPVSIWLYHITLSSSVTGARRQTFWDRVLLGGPVSLARILVKERAMAQEVTLHDYKSVQNFRSKESMDLEIEEMISSGDFGGARAQAWKIIEVARDARDDSTVAKYQEYLEIIAEEESISVGQDAGSIS